MVDRYIEAWNHRAAELAELFTGDVFYCDPLVTTRGRTELAAYIGNTMRQFDGMAFRADGVDGHHDQVRFTWSLGPAAGDPAVTGLDVAILDGGRFRAIHGFFD